MFPRPSTPHRGNPGTLNGSLGTTRERSDGKCDVSFNSLSILSPDPADQIQYEFFMGGMWIAASFEPSLYEYEAGSNFRARAINSYFGTAGAYITGTAGADADTGGISAYTSFLSSLPAPTFISRDYIDFGVSNRGGRYSYIFDNIPVELRAAGNRPGQFKLNFSVLVRDEPSPMSPTYQVDFEVFAAKPAAGALSFISPFLQSQQIHASFLGWTLSYTHTYPDGPTVTQILLSG